jgi:hypothetical protein
MSFNPIMTLGQIRSTMSLEAVWNRLISELDYKDGALDQSNRVSLGDVAAINGAEDALKCLGILDWSNNLTLRQAVIGRVLLPAARRAAANTINQKVHAVISMVQRWCDGDTVDLLAQARSVQGDAWRATVAAAAAMEPAALVAAAAVTGHETAVRASKAAVTAAAMGPAARAAWEAAGAARPHTAQAAALVAAAHAAMDAGAAAAEAEAQRRDIMAAFPPVASERRR